MQDGERGDGISSAAQTLLALLFVLSSGTHQKGDFFMPALRYRVEPGCCCLMLASAKNHSHLFLDEWGLIFKTGKLLIPYFQEEE